MATSTPWGPSQTSREVAPGICFYSTARHGGYHLSLDRFDIFRQCFPDYKLWAGDQWFEEDCDAALVTITFAEAYSDESVFFAEQSIAPVSGMRKLLMVSGIKSGSRSQTTKGSAQFYSARPISAATMPKTGRSGVRGPMAARGKYF